MILFMTPAVLLVLSKPRASGDDPLFPGYKYENGK